MALLASPEVLLSTGGDSLVRGSPAEVRGTRSVELVQELLYVRLSQSEGSRHLLSVSDESPALRLEKHSKPTLAGHHYPLPRPHRPGCKCLLSSSLTSSLALPSQQEPAKRISTPPQITPEVKPHTFSSPSR